MREHFRHQVPVEPRPRYFACTVFSDLGSDGIASRGWYWVVRAWPRRARSFLERGREPPIRERRLSSAPSSEETMAAGGPYQRRRR